MVAGKTRVLRDTLKQHLRKKEIQNTKVPGKPVGNLDKTMDSEIKWTLMSLERRVIVDKWK